MPATSVIIIAGAFCAALAVAAVILGVRSAIAQPDVPTPPKSRRLRTAYRAVKTQQMVNRCAAEDLRLQLDAERRRNESLSLQNAELRKQVATLTELAAGTHKFADCP